jgi:hypothetical protein
MYVTVYEMTSPANNDLKVNVMVENPLNIAQVKPSDRPIWLCKHPEAKILSFDPRRFICKKCDKSHIIKIVSQREILGTISTNSVRSEYKE